MRIISGDQSILWDTLLKLKLLTEMGHSVEHVVHTGDLFSRPPRGSDRPLVTKESYLPNGNVNRWTACIEATPFLGKMAVPVDCLRNEYNLDLEAVLRGQSKKGMDAEKVICRLTCGDWIGLSHPNENLVAYGIEMSELLPTYQKLRKPLRRNALESLGQGGVEAFDNIFQLTNYPTVTWSEATESHLTGLLDRYNVSDVSVTNSVKMFGLDECYSKNSLLWWFVTYYDQARKAYNASANGDGGCLRQLEEGELPYYAVVRCEDGSVVRHDLSCQPNDTLAQVIENVSRHGEVLAVLGKALLLLLDLRMRSSLILPEMGSPYSEQSYRFMKLFTEAIGKEFNLNPVYRLRINALDALACVEQEIALPEYLHDSFGTDRISGEELADSWSGVAEMAKHEAGMIANPPKGRVALRRFLSDDDLLGDVLINCLDALLVDKGLYDEQMAEHHADPEKVEIFRKLHDPNGLKVPLQALNDLIVVRITERVCACLQVCDSLRYWNCRPFSHWVLGLPGWYEGIREAVEVEEEFSDTSADLMPA
jgi:hypothetical protein